MVVSQVQQPDGTFSLLQRFTYPDPDRGAVDAVAVTVGSGRLISSAYTIMSSMIVVHVWGIVIASGFYFYLRNPKHKVSDISVSLWNKRAATQQSILDVVLYARDDLKKWWYYPMLMGIIFAWAAGILAGIFVPSKLFIGNAAPVTAASIYVPFVQRDNSSNLAPVAQLFALDAQPYIRASGTAMVANETLREKVNLGQTVTLGQHTNGAIQRVDYGYVVTGADMGLQHLPDLQLTVNGSCVTDYSWWVRAIPDSPLGRQEFYRNPFNNAIYNVSKLNSPAPSARFLVQTTPPAQNISWGIIVSSVDRHSFTSSDDPWYKTRPTINLPDVPFIVQEARPALLCWQNDVWTYSGQSARVGELRKIVPPLSERMAKLLDHRLGLPVIYKLGTHLGVSALKSSLATTGTIFDAGASSFTKDLYQLLLASYIATVNTFTDMTLYLGPGDVLPPLTNLARNEQNQPYAGVDAFVVYTSKVTALSVVTLIVVPTLALGTFVLTLLLFKFSPLKLATAMEVIEHFRILRDQFGEATIERAENGEPLWKYDHMPKPTEVTDGKDGTTSKHGPTVTENAAEETEAVAEETEAAAEETEAAAEEIEAAAGGKDAAEKKEAK